MLLRRRLKTRGGYRKTFWRDSGVDSNADWGCGAHGLLLEKGRIRRGKSKGKRVMPSWGGGGGGGGGGVGH